MSICDDKEKLILNYIVTICGIYCLNEKEAENYIQSHSHKHISRRTYYNYKKKIYENFVKSLNQYVKDREDETEKSQYPKLLIDIRFLKSKTLAAYISNIERQKQFWVRESIKDCIIKNVKKCTRKTEQCTTNGIMDWKWISHLSTDRIPCFRAI